MRKFIMLTILGGTMVLFGAGACFAQGTTLTPKQIHNQTLPDHYDAWKVSAVAPAANVLVSSSTALGFTTHVVQLGFDLADASAATAYENKIHAQPGINEIFADFANDRVTVVVKEADEHNVLKKCFDIQ